MDRIGVEAFSWIASLHRLLEKNEYVVTILHPKKTRYIAEAKIRTVDSRAAAGLVRLDALPSAYTPDQEIAMLGRDPT